MRSVNTGCDQTVLSSLNLKLGNATHACTSQTDRNPLNTHAILIPPAPQLDSELASSISNIQKYFKLVNELVLTFKAFQYDMK